MYEAALGEVVHLLAAKVGALVTPDFPREAIGWLHEQLTENTWDNWDLEALGLTPDARGRKHLEMSIRARSRSAERPMSQLLRPDEEPPREARPVWRAGVLSHPPPLPPPAEAPPPRWASGALRAAPPPPAAPPPAAPAGERRPPIVPALGRPLGCPKCRWSATGCAQCRSPSYRPRGPDTRPL